LKTEDGFDIFHNDSYYAVYHDTILPHIASGGITYGIPFKEKANAEKYLAENNKKNISWAELEEFILRATWNQNINTGKDFLMIYYEDFINRFKPKS
jgi:nitrous oxide reductase accessory protein NosL